MRHRLHHRKLNRTSAHRKAMHRNLTQSMIEHGYVRTTLPKAKDLRPVVEKVITLALQARNAEDSGQRLAARRRLHKYLSDRAIIPEEHKDAYEGMSDAGRNKTLHFATGRRHRMGQAKGKLAFTAESVLRRLIDTVAPRFEGRPGGYTRVIRLAGRRLGDHTSLAILQFVGDEQSPGSVTKPRKTARRTRTDARYGAAVKALRGSGKGQAAAVETKAETKAAATEESASCTPSNAPRIAIMPTDPACVFCKIAAGAISARRVMETEHVLAFLDAAPLAPGHTLLIPKDHYPSIGDAPTEVLARLSAALPGLSKAILRATGAAGFNVLQNNGSVAGQVVMHMHFHLIPRRESDGLGYRWTPMKPDSARDDAVAEHIRKSFNER